MKSRTFTEDLLLNCIQQDTGETHKTMLAEYDVIAKKDNPGYWLRGANNEDCETFDCDEIVDKNSGIHEEDYEIAKKLFNIERSSNELVSVTIRFCCDEEGFKHYEITSKVLNNIQGEAVKLILIIRDVEEELKAKRKLWRMINYDKLTGLLNAEGFYVASRTFMRNRIGQFCILRLDIRNFSLANAILGAEKSDDILIELAAELRDKLGNAAVVGRIGADVFAVCMKKSDFSNLDYSVIENAVYKSKVVNYEVEFAIGIYEAEDIEESVANMCAKAKLAMREAKRNSGSNVGYYEKIIEQKYFEQQQLVIQKNAALKNGEFKVYLQPQCCLKTGEIESAEALVRWEHPERDLLSPADFVPIFEENGFIKQLDAYVLKEVCNLLLQWKKAGKKLIPISVNVSRVDLFDPHIASKIKNIVDASGIDPKYIELEITETAYMDNPQVMMSTMAKIKDSGFNVIMDDFGSGYSSLNMLRNIPVDKLKIDLKFMQGIKESGKARSILRFIVDMADTLDIITVAEGVEDIEQLEILSEYGCDYAQGYLYSKPIPAVEFEERYIKNSAFDDLEHILQLNTVKYGNGVKKSCV